MHQNGNDYVYDITKIDKKKKVQPKSQNSEATGNETATPSNQKVTQAESKVNTKGVKLQIADEDSEGSKLTEEQQANTTLQIWRVVQPNWSDRHYR